MKTYNTIQEAFLKGLGDVFFTKDNQFTCVHRNDVEAQDKLLNNGFLMLSYDETLRLAKLTVVKPTESIVLETKTIVQHIKSRVVVPNYFNCNSDAYEFSDADPGL